MNKKEVLVIVLAFILALVFANFMMKNNKNIRSTKQNVQIEENIKKDSDFPIEAEIDMPVANKSSIFVEEAKVNAGQDLQDANNIHEVNIAPKVEKLVVETTDYGIKKSEETGIVEITREFRAESPSKYSFRGYGVLSKNTVK